MFDQIFDVRYTSFGSPWLLSLPVGGTYDANDNEDNFRKKGNGRVDFLQWEYTYCLF